LTLAAPASHHLGNRATPDARARGDDMSNTLLTAAAAAIILAVVGGGAKAFGVEVPVLTSRKRQAGLALVGVAFFAAAVLLRNDNDGAAGKAVQAYRQDVLAACRGLEQVGGLPPLNHDLTVDRDPFLAWTRSQLATSVGILNAVWERPVPEDLKGERDDARDDARDLANRTRAGLDRLEQVLPTRFPYLQGRPAALQQFTTELATPSARFEASMSELAGEPCRPRQAAGGG
jgi:hypothetical protein